MPDSNACFSNVEIEYVPTASLKPFARQVRRHSQGKIQRLAKFMEKSGVIIPLIVDKDNLVILGNARLSALNYLSVETIPVIRVTHLDESMVRALILADNQFVLNASWYKDILRDELINLAPHILDLGLELTDLGFETAEIDLRIGDIEFGTAEDEVPSIQGRAPISQLGNIWVMGNHKLLCGDARDENAYRQLMGTELAEMVFGDLPYNVPIEGHVCGNGAIEHKEFVMAAGEMTPDQFVAFMRTIFDLLRKFSIDGSIHMHCMDWRHGLDILTAAQQAGYGYLNMACWVKHTGGMGSLYRSQHELIHVFKSGTSAHINNVRLGKFGRNRTNVWNYDGANSFRASRKDDLKLHSTTKPVDMVSDAIKDCSNREGIILDPTAGAGTTLIAAERTGRIARLIELDPLYCDVVVARWQKLTGKKAILGETGQAFDDIPHHEGIAP